MSLPLDVTVHDLAQLLGIGPRRVQQLVREKIIARGTRGRYPLPESVRGYVRYLSAQASDDATDLTAQRIRLTKAQADMAELDLQQRAGQLVSVDEITAEWGSMLATVRTRLLAMPAKLAPVIVTERTAGGAFAMLEREVHEALTELSRTGDAETAA